MAELVEVLGPGWRRCVGLHDLGRTAARTDQPGVEGRYITNPVETVGRGFLMGTPAVVLGGTAVAAGVMPQRREIRARLQAQRTNQEVHP